MVPIDLINFEWIWMGLDGFRLGFVWIWMDLHPQLGLLCGAALPGAFFSRKNMSLVFLKARTVFLAFY